MAELDRADTIALLDRLGAESDETVLEAARVLHRKITEAGLSWDELLRSGLEPEDEDETDEAPGGWQPIDDSDDGPIAGAEKAEIERLIDRLLARRNLSGTMREDLTELKTNLAEGSFEAMDARYVRALAKRLEG